MGGRVRSRGAHRKFDSRLIVAAALRPGNAITLLRNGEEYFPALEAAIQKAQRDVYLETYIFADDESGRRIADALARAVARGVQTRVLVDGFGSHDLAGNLLEDMRTRGVEVQIFRPEVARFRFRRHRLRPFAAASDEYDLSRSDL